MTDLATFLGLVEEKPAVVSLADHLRHLSASSIGMLLRCPHQFYHRYMLGEKERPGESIVLGSVFHESISFNYDNKVRTGDDKPLSDVLQFLGDVAVPKVIEESGGIDNIRWDSDLDTTRSDAEKITAAYHRSVCPRVTPLATETKFTLDVPEVEIPLIGYIDLEEQGRTIDTKTGKQAVRKPKPSWRFQGMVYAFATQKPTEFHSVSRAKTPSIVTAKESEELVIPVPTMTQMTNFTHIVQTAANLLRYFIENDTWPTWGAVPDFSRTLLPCDYCGWRQKCPAWA